MAKEIKSNPFLDDDDVDDAAFLNHPHQGTSGYMLENTSVTTKDQNDWEAKRRQLLLERRRIEDRTLQSTHNSLGLLHESEQVGVLTAEELVKQREQLDNISENLDLINSTMRTSQKQINALKGVFGRLKNYFTKEEQTDLPIITSSDPRPRSQSSTLSNTIDNIKSDTRLSEASHPALRIRDLDYDDEVDSFVKVTAEKISSPPAAKATTNIDEKIDKNLEFMSLGLGRLKNLAIGLNDEIEQQNEMIDVIHNKADKADETLDFQNRQIKRILKK